MIKSVKKAASLYNQQNPRHLSPVFVKETERVALDF